MMFFHRTQLASVWKKALFVSFVLIGFLGAPNWGSALADDVKALLKQANNELRTVQNLMFSGKNEEAVAALPKIQTLIEQAKSADPENTSIKTVENKLAKLIMDLERRTGKDLGAGTLTAQSSSREAELPSKPEAKPLEKAATEQVAVASSEGKLPGGVSSRLNKIEAALKKGDVKAAQRLMGEIERGYPDQLNHPDVSAARDRISSASGDTEKAAAPSPAASVASKKEAEGATKLPYEARRPMQQIAPSFGFIERGIAKLKDPDYRGSKDQIVNNLNSGLLDIEAKLANARELAAQKGVNSHPDFDEVESRLAEMKETVEQAVAEYEQSKTLAAERSEAVNDDVEALRSDYERLQEVFNKAPGTVIYYNDLDTLEKTIEVIEDFEKNDLSDLSSKIQDFAAKYGSSPEEIDKKTSELGYSGQGRASYPYEALVKGALNVNNTRVVMAEDIAQRVEDKLQNLPRLHDFSRLEQHDVIRQWMQMAQRFSPGHPKVQEVAAKLEPALADDLAASKKRMAGRTWPGHASNAPKNADELVEAAMDYFNQVNAQEKDPRRQLAVVITGPWSVQKTNLLGEPIMYGLPVLGAVQLDREKDKNLARVFVLTLRTPEAKGVKMAPPFASVTVGDSYYILADKVK